MYRQFTILFLLLLLLMTACTSAPAPTSTPTEPAAGAIEEATAEATAEATEENTEENIEESTTEEVETEEAEAPVMATETVTATEVVTSTEMTTATETATATETVTATEAVTDGAESTALTGCLEPDADTQLISSPVAGYCLLIPATFSRSEFSDVEGFNLGIYGPETTPGHRERGFVKVTSVTTQTLEGSVQAIVDEVVAMDPGFTPTQTTLTLGGLPAIQIDNLPGQDANRKVFALYEGRLYELTFVPADDGRPDANAEMEELYALVIESFRFMSATNATSSFASFLTWEGEIDGACHTLTIQPNGEAAVTLCGDAPTSTTILDNEAGEWAMIQEHFGNIDTTTPAGQITFQGQGSAEGEQWAQALATWASFTAMELNAGQTSASARTILAWKVTDTAEHSGQCSHLVVLAYGYAYANVMPCDDNGPSTQVAAGWLTNSELDTLYQWVATGERVEDDAGYLDVQGDTPISPEEITNWAKAIYARMIQ